MIIASAPTRISLSSADHDSFSNHFGGVALNFAINKRVYVIIRNRNELEDFRFRVSYSKTELCNNINDIELGLVREGLKMLDLSQSALEIVYVADIATQTGVGTSSALAVALLKGLLLYQNAGISNELLADYAYQLERVRLQEAGGFQDFYPACFGGVNYLTGCPGRINRVSIPLRINQVEEFEEHSFVVFTGNRSSSSGILEEQLSSLRQGKTLEETLKLKKLVEEMYAIMISPSFRPLDLAAPLTEAWQMKKKLSTNMTGPCVTKIEEIVLSVDPSAGLRLVGGGGDRGLVFVLTKPHFKKVMKERLADFKTFDMKIDWDGVSARKLFVKS